MTHKPMVTTILLSLIGLVFSTVPTTALAQLKPFDRESIKIRDSIRLKSGSTLHGKILSEGKDVDSGREYTTFRTQAASTLKLDSRFVDRSRPITENDKLYNNRIEIMDDSADQHWAAIDWCNKQSAGSVIYKDQIDFHLNRIMLLDPNDKRAKSKLGYSYIEPIDRWLPKKLYWESLGYKPVRGKNSFAPTIQDSINGMQKNRGGELGERKRRFAAWKKLLKRNVSATELKNDLFDWCDAAAVPIVFKEAQEEKNNNIRGMYVEALGRIKNSRNATEALVFFSVEDKAFRDRALDLLLQNHINADFAASHMARYFDPKKYSRATLQRAAFNIGELNTENSILTLTNVLSTKHVVQPAGDPGRLNTGFSKNGDISSFGVGGSGAAKSVVFKNDEVLKALGKITGENLGFDPLVWKRWYVQNHTLVEVDVRGDDE